jgi:SMODS-associated and fused to various effectors sensor domain
MRNELMSGQIPENDRLTPSLLEPQSRGGEVADGGFFFQDHIILAHIPEWMSQESFTAFVKEAIGDFEAKFYVPGYGFAKDFIEVKNHTLKPAEFWEEIRRFQQIATGSPSTYRRFILVSAGSSEGLNPILNGLRRVQGSQDVYEEQDVVRNNSVQEYIRLVESSDHTQQDALFLLNYVTVETDWNAVKLDGEAIFKERLVKFLKDYEDLPAKILIDIYNHLSAFVRKNINRSISRKELEVVLREKIPTNQKPDNRSIRLYTAISPQDSPSNPGLRFDWSQFSGGETRAIAPPEKWEQLLVELQDTRTWIENYRNTKRIRLQGNRRLPACLVIGSVFSAVRGYVIEMEYREEIWKTDSHATAETPEYSLTHKMLPNKDTALIVSISICRNISSEVKANLKQLGLMDTPFLDIQGEQAITSPEQVNRVVKDIKNLIVQNLQLTKGKVIHLFYAGPAHLALFLGHRLDATAPVICYGWTGKGQYSRTCQLFVQSNHIEMVGAGASIPSLQISE